jgi:hypothetical protein
VRTCAEAGPAVLLVELAQHDEQLVRRRIDLRCEFRYGVAEAVGVSLLL